MLNLWSCFCLFSKTFWVHTENDSTRFLGKRSNPLLLEMPWQQSIFFFHVSDWNETITGWETVIHGMIRTHHSRLFACFFLLSTLLLYLLLVNETQRPDKIISTQIIFVCVWILLHFFWFNIIVNTFNRIIFKNIGFLCLSLRLKHEIRI